MRYLLNREFLAFYKKTLSSRKHEMTPVKHKKGLIGLAQTRKKQKFRAFQLS